MKRYMMFSTFLVYFALEYAGRPCICDSNLNTFQEESGNIIAKVHFPLVRLFSGETGGGGEQVKYTLGPLTCQGGQCKLICIITF